MTQRNMPKQKKSAAEKTASDAPDQAVVPPPDNPLLRFQAEEGPLEDEPSQKEKARLRAKAWEQTRRAAASDSDAKSAKPDDT